MFEVIYFGRWVSGTECMRLQLPSIFAEAQRPSKVSPWRHPCGYNRTCCNIRLVVYISSFILSHYWTSSITMSIAIPPLIQLPKGADRQADWPYGHWLADLRTEHCSRYSASNFITVLLTAVFLHILTLLRHADKQHTVTVGLHW